MKPPKSILDPTFKYRASIHTDIRKTFAELRKVMEEQKPPQVVELRRKS